MINFSIHQAHIKLRETTVEATDIDSSINEVAKNIVDKKFNEQETVEALEILVKLKKHLTNKK